MSLGTKFSNMPIGVRNRWIAWAQSHDWGRGAYFEDGRIYGIIETSFDDNNRMHEEEVSFSTPREMRNWAGY